MIYRAISDIKIDAALQPRAALDEHLVSEYAEAMQAGSYFPAIKVFHFDNEYWLVDGFHRYNAAEKNGDTQIEIDIHEGNRRAALLYSVGANATHGLGRMIEDKRRAVQKLLQDPEWKQWSNVRIAKQCQVSDPFVGKIRAEVSSNDSKIDAESRRKVERGGTIYEQKIGDRKRRPAVAAAKPKAKTIDDTQLWTPEEREVDQGPQEPKIIHEGAEAATRDVKNLIDIRFRSIDSEEERHAFIKNLLKYLGEKTHELNPEIDITCTNNQHPLTPTTPEPS